MVDREVQKSEFQKAARWFQSTLFEKSQKFEQHYQRFPRFNSKYCSISKNISADSIQKIIQLNSQGIIDTGQI